MNKVLKIIGLVLLVAGSAIANFTDIVVADYISIAVAAFGLALTIVGVWKSSEKKSWKELVGIICFSIAGFLCGVAGIAQDTMTTLITGIVAVVSMLIGILTTFVLKDKAEATE